MTMTYDDVAELLAFCAVYDQRRGDDLDVKAWLMVATDHRWTRDTAFRVAREHYGAGAGRPRLDPATITDRLRSVRGQAAESFEAPRIPEDLPNHEYPAWLRRRLAAHCDAVLERWAATGEDPPRALPAAPAVVADLDQLITRAPIQHRRAISSGVKAIRERKVRLDPVRREQAHAELEEARRLANTEDAS